VIVVMVGMRMVMAGHESCFLLFRVRQTNPKPRHRAITKTEPS
jgi:hypothetical protein